MRPAAAAMKALLAKPGLQIMPGCGDGLGARLIAEAGFGTGFVSGSNVSALRLAQPDMDLLSFTEMLDAVQLCADAAPEVCWLADGDTGYGSPINCRRTIKAYARAGAAAVLIEDKALPRPLGKQGAKLVVERDEALQRLKAAIEVAHEEGILILARTDARVSRGFPEALARLEEFVAMGADLLFLDSPQSEAEMVAGIAACKGKPSLSVTVQSAKFFMPDDATLERLGIKIAVYPQAMLAASIHAMRGALGAIKGGPAQPMGTAADLGTAIRMADYLALDARLAKG